MRSNDAETQQYLSNLIGVDKTLLKSASCHLDESMNRTGYSQQLSEGREPRIFPHEFATLKDVLLLSPDGFFRLDKIPPDYDMVKELNSRENGNYSVGEIQGQGNRKTRRVCKKFTHIA